MRELAEHHVGGYLKVAPEHTDPDVLALMKKPGNDDFEEFDREFKRGQQAGRQEAVPHSVLHRQPPRQRPGRDDRPGRCSSSATATSPTRCRISSPARSTSPPACTTRVSTRSRRSRCISPGTCATASCSGRCCSSSSRRIISKSARRWKQAGRQDLIGNGCDCLIPATPPKAALDKRRKRANESLREQTAGDHIRGGPDKSYGVGYRPGRKGRRRNHE